MKNLILIAALAFLFVFSIRANAYDINNVNVERVKDGDTIEVSFSGVQPVLGHKLGIRLKGVDAPEIRKGKTEGIEAKALVKKALQGARVDLVNCTRGKYYRLVCKIKYDGNDLGELLVNKKLGKLIYE